MNRGLWIVQVLLALLFLFAGSMKLVLPIEEMTKEIAMPGWFLRFIGVAEVARGARYRPAGSDRHPSRSDAAGGGRTGAHHDRRGRAHPGDRRIRRRR